MKKTAKAILHEETQKRINDMVVCTLALNSEYQPASLADELSWDYKINYLMDCLERLRKIIPVS